MTKHPSEPPTDVFYKKTVTLPYADRELRFRVSQDLFSSHDIDEGTRLLLRSLARMDIPLGAKILDLGCGYGPLGLALASADPARDVHLVDRDALAVEYARQNAALNGIENARVYASLGYDDVPDRDFDLIVSNIPAKAGERVIAHLLRAAGRLLAPNGSVAIVVIDPIAKMVAGILDATPAIEVTFTRATASYTVFHYRFTSPPESEPDAAFEQGVYASRAVTIEVGGGEHLALETALGLDDDEAPSAVASMLITALTETPALEEAALILNPGQGYVPLALARIGSPSRMLLVDRDLLALRQSAANLERIGIGRDAIDLTHAATLRDDLPDLALVAGVVREDEGQDAINLMLDRASSRLVPGGSMLLGASSTGATRIERHINQERMMRVVSRERKRGWSVIRLERR